MQYKYNYLSSLITMNKIYFLIFFLFSYSFIKAQDKSNTKPQGITVLGQIKDDENEYPVENVIVKLVAVKDSTQISSGLTDSEGKFQLKAKWQVFFCILFITQFILFL